MILGSFQVFSAPHAVRWIGYAAECEHLELHTLSESFRMWKRSLWLIALLIWETSSESEHREMCQVDELSRRCTETCWTPGNFRRPKQVFLIFFVEVERNLWLEIIQHGAVKSAIVETYLFMSAFSSSALLPWLIDYHFPNEILHSSLSETKSSTGEVPHHTWCHNTPVIPI